MNPIRRRPASRLVAAATTLALSVAGLLTATAGPAGATAPQLGTLTYAPATGATTVHATVSTVSSSSTSAGCPSSTSYVNVVWVQLSRNDGQPITSAWSSGLLALGSTATNTISGYQSGSDFSVSLADTWGGIAQSNSSVINPGTYQLTLNCLDQFTSPIGSFVGKIWFTGSSTPATAYQYWNPAGTAVTPTLTASPAGSQTQGSPVSLTATVSPTAAAGTITFRDGSAVLGTRPLSNGSATLSTSSLALGGHSLTAVFAPADPSTYQPGTSAALSYTITSPSTAAATTTTVAAQPATSAASGTPVTFTATVSPSAAAGSVQFTDTVNGVTGNLGAPVPVGSGGTASYQTSSLAVGTHTIGARFTPTDTTAYQPSTGSVGYTITGAQPTTTTLAAGPAGSAVLGSPVTLTATLSPASAAGTVQFRDTANGTTANLGSPVSVSSGTASYTTSSLAAGSHSFTAVFTPTSVATYAGSTSAPVGYQVTHLAQLGSLTITPTYGTVTTRGGVATVSSGTPKGCPSNTVYVNAVWQQLSRNDGQPITSAWSAGLLALGTTGVNTINGYAPGSDFSEPLSDTWGGIAQTNSQQITAGEYQVTVNCLDQFTGSLGFFRGDLWFTDATNYQTLNPATNAVPTSTGLATSPYGVVDMGNAVKITASVYPSGAAGTVQFQNVANSVPQNLGAQVSVVSGVASLTCSTTSSSASCYLPFGMYVFQAVFRPTNPAQYDPSTSPTVTFAVRYPPPPTIVSGAVLKGYVGVGSRVACSAYITNYNSLSYAWYLDGHAISGATASSYVPTSSQYLHQLSCAITARNYAPTAVTTTSSKATIGLGHFVLVSVPTVSGTYAPGYTLTCGHGTWSPTPAAYYYQWLRNGYAISGATYATYRFTRADVGQLISVRVTVTHPYYANGVAYGPAIRNTSRPYVSGTAKVGYTLYAHVGSWTPSPTSYSYQWLRNGVAISGATGASYRLSSADSGRYISVRVTAHRAYFSNGSAVSASVLCA